MPRACRRRRTSRLQIIDVRGIRSLLGYLYLKKEWKRMLELVKIGLDSIKEQ